MITTWFFVPTALARRLISPVFAAGLMVFACGSARAQSDPPPETHNNDLFLGRASDYGGSGSQAALGFSDYAANPSRFTAWLNEVHTLIPNISGPSGMGNLYFNLGTDGVRVASGNPPVSRTVLTGASLVASNVTPGLIAEKFGQAIFSSNAAETANNNTFNYPFTNSFHHHYNLRVFRPGTYQITLQVKNAVARSGGSLADSPTYTITFQSRAVLSSRLVLTGWAGVDLTPYQTGSKARVYVFAANSNPARESDAIATTDVYLDGNGSFQMPEGVVTDGSYRIGIKPLTAPGLARLYPGNVTLSATSAPNLAALKTSLGDVNRDGVIDEFDYNAVVQDFYTINSDVNGDGFTDEFDYNAVVQSLYNVGDFLP